MSILRLKDANGNWLDIPSIRGVPGISIKSITRTSGNGAPGTADTYTIAMTDGSTSTFQVHNGTNGEGAGDMTEQVYDPQGKKQDIFKYVDDAVANIDLPDIELPDNIGDMQASVYDPQGKAQDIFKYVDDAVGNIELPDDIGDMQAAVYDPQGKAQDIFKYVDDAVGIPNLGENITEGSTNDTVAFWADKGSGQAWFSSMNMLIDQPSEYGILINHAHTTEIFQIFRRMPDGPAYWRSGNANGWNGSWAKVYDSYASEVPTTNADGELIMDGNIKGHYVTGEWLRTVADDTHRTNPAEKIAVLDGGGWVYYRTPAEILSDIGAAAEDHTHDNLGGSTFHEVTIGTTWTENEDTGVKSQTISITGVTASKNAHVEPRYTGDGTSEGYAAFVEQKNQFFTCITNGYAETVADGITFHIFGDAPTVSIPVLVEVK